MSIDYAIIFTHHSLQLHDDLVQNQAIHSRETPFHCCSMPILQISLNTDQTKKASFLPAFLGAISSTAKLQAHKHIIPLFHHTIIVNRLTSSE